MYPENKKLRKIKKKAYKAYQDTVGMDDPARLKAWNAYQAVAWDYEEAERDAKLKEDKEQRASMDARELLAKGLLRLFT